MPLQDQIISLPFNGGLDTKSDPKQVIAGELLILENAVWTTPKKFRKRNGYVGISNAITVPIPPTSYSNLGAAIAAGCVLSSYNGEMVLHDGMNLYSWSPASSTWIYRGRAELCSLTQTQIVANNYTSLMQDSAYNAAQGVTVFAWESWTADPVKGGTLLGVQLSIIDAVTGATVLGSGSLVSTSSSPKCLSIGSNLYVVYFDSSDSKLHFQAVTAAGLGASGVLVSDPNAGIAYDLTVIGSLVYLGYWTSAPSIKITSFNSSLVLQASSTVSDVALGGISVFGDSSNNVWCAYRNSSAANAVVMNSALTATVLAPTVLDASAGLGKNITGVFDGTKGVVFYDSPGVPILGQQVGANLPGGAITLAANYTQPAVGATVSITVSFAGFNQVGQIVNIATGGSYYVNSVFNTTVTLTNLGYAGSAAPGATVSSPENIYATAGFQNALVSYQSVTIGGTLGTASKFCRSVALASKAFLQSGFAHVVLTRDSPTQSMYFLCSLFNVGGPTPPAHVVAKISESSQGGGIPYRSLLSNANAVGSNKFQFALLDHALSVSSLFAGGNPGGNALTAFLNGVITVTANLAPTQLPKNTLGNNLHVGGGNLKMYDGANSVEHGFNQYPESLTNSVATSGGWMSAGLYGYCALYSWIDNQGQVHRSAPSPVINAYQQAIPNIGPVTITIPTLRLTEKTGVTIELYRTAANGTVYYRIDTLLSAYSFANSVSTDSITVVDNLADNLIIGSRQLYTTGEVADIGAPSCLSMTSFKSRIILIPSENPYTWWFSKQVIPGYPAEFSLSFVKNIGSSDGPLTAVSFIDDKLILFKANAIYYVVGTGPGASGAGDDFTDPIFIPGNVGCIDPASIIQMEKGILFKSNKGIYLLDRGLNVSYAGAPVDAYNASHVLSAQTVQGLNQIRFLLDNGNAAVLDYLVEKWGTHTNISSVDSCLWSGKFTYLTASGAVMVESPATFSDNGSFIKLKVGTSWLQFSGVQGFQRIRKMLVLGDYVGPHNLVINVFKDFNAGAVVQTTTIPGSVINGAYQWSVDMTQQKCESMMFTIEDSQSSGFNEGLSLSAMAFEVGMKKGAFKLGATQSYG